MTKLKFDEIIEVNNQKLTKKYIQSLSYEEREALIEPIFQILRSNGFPQPDDTSDFEKDYKKLCNLEIDINQMERYNNSSLCTNICKHFCPSFYKTTERNKKTMEEVFNDDTTLRRMIKNRLGMDWYYSDNKGPGVNEAFNLSPKMFLQCIRSMRLVNSTSFFKPDIAKFMALKYSNENDTIFDMSIGFGGRLLGTISANRKYIGTDPLTAPEVENMAEFLKFDKNNYTLIQSGSENYCGGENSVDFVYSSIPYFDQELYSNDKTQAYNNGEDYYYNVYWRKTLENTKFMLKSGKWFGINITVKYYKVVEIAQEYFGEIVEKVGLRTVRSHLTKGKNKQPDQKLEYIYMFKNVK